MFHRVFFGPDPAAVASWLRSAGCGFAFKERFGEVRDMHFRAFFCTFRFLKPGELVSRFSPVFPGRPRFSLGAGLGPVRSGLPLAGCGFAIRHGPSLGVRPCFVHRFSPGFTGFHRFSIGPDPAAVAPGLRSAGCGFAFKERFGGVRDMHFRPFFCTFRQLVG